MRFSLYKLVIPLLISSSCSQVKSPRSSSCCCCWGCCCWFLLADRGSSCTITANAYCMLMHAKASLVRTAHQPLSGPNFLSTFRPITV